MWLLLRRAVIAQATTVKVLKLDIKSAPLVRFWALLWSQRRHFACRAVSVLTSHGMRNVQKKLAHIKYVLYRLVRCIKWKNQETLIFETPQTHGVKR